MALKVGDTVRYLSAVGGGVVTRLEGKMAYVEENGFETPVLISDLVVVMPASAKTAEGNSGARKGPNLMFDQKAYDAGRAPEMNENVNQQPTLPASEPELPVVETEYGDVLNLSLAFEPTDLKKLSDSQFNAVLVNDSNYFLSFVFMGREGESRGWDVIYQGVVGPNELIDLGVFNHLGLNRIERVALQAVAFKKERRFEMKSPVNAVRRLDLTKFHKFHCFRPGVYFDTPVLEFPLMSEDVSVTAPEVHADNTAALLSSKFRVKDADRKPEKKHKPDAASNPHKVLPLIEVDLHINSLLDNTNGLRSVDMLNLQLDNVRATMRANSKRKGQKIVFIHGKGDGVLRKEMLKVLSREFPKGEVQDASFREYGFGASMVTIR